MKVNRITVSYTEKRSINYQSVEHGVSVDLVLDEGETLGKEGVSAAVERARDAIRNQVTNFTWTECFRLAQEADRAKESR